MKGFFANVAEFIKNNSDLKALFSPLNKRQDESAVHYEVRTKEKNRRNRFFFLFLPLAFFYLEVIFHIFVYSEFSVVSFVLTALFSFSFGFLVNGVALLTPLKVNRIISLITLIFTTLIIVSQYVYYTIFGDLYTVSLMDMAGDAATNFMGMLLDGIGRGWLCIVLLFLPLVFFIAKLKKYSPSFAPSFNFRIILLVLSLLLYLLSVGIVTLDRGNVGSGNYHYYTTEFRALESTKRFGVVTNMRLDVKAMLFGTKEAEVIIPSDVTPPPFETSADTTSEEIPPEPIVYEDNVMDIDFETLIADAPNDTIKKMHEYFASVTPTKQNEYTGLFEGKNLIFLTLEGFSYKTIDKERTPTLYKMANEGFVFTNSYTSLWGGSTATGEYAAMTGNFHQSAKCLGMCGGKNMYFALGNQFSRIGYDTYAFHNHTYDYYSRHKSHPTMGYEYIAIGNGLEKAPINEAGDTIRGGWPRSDYEMALATLPYYINSDKPFHVYYMTVSGHANYNFGGNNMSSKHRDIVESMSASDSIKAYHACQYEVELMLAELVRALDEAGKLEDTVFVMSADHYPYALTPDELKELYSITASDVYDDLDLLRNSIIIWCADMEEPVVIDKPCSSIDIIPTVSNLFGLEYDSRLLMGTDILSESDPLVILNALFTGPNWCWMNKYGTYNGSTGIFTPAEGFTATEEELNAYVKQINNLLWAKRNYSPKILEKDYYSYIFE
ncbi:MAG: sulfatase-like hydrolase/transferase [Clostridia bacterium]|nr:sulfatase-like hydrolase/transferase [Clostridia bacterium]